MIKRQANDAGFLNVCCGFSLDLMLGNIGMVLAFEKMANH